MMLTVVKVLDTRVGNSKMSKSINIYIQKNSNNAVKMSDIFVPIVNDCAYINWYKITSM